MTRFEGVIDSIHKNYGVIKSKVDNYTVKYLFIIFPDMLKNRCFEISKKVTSYAYLIKLEEQRCIWPMI